MMNNQDQMHPDDWRNFILFVVASLALWFSFDHFILQPRMQAMEAAAQQAAEDVTVKNDGAAAITEGAPRDRAEVLAENHARLPIDNGAIFGSLSLQGGRIDDISLQTYYRTLEKKDHVVLFSPAGSNYPKYAEFGWVAADKSVKTPDKTSRWRVAEGDLAKGLSPDTPITLYWENGAGLRFERTLEIDDQFLMTVKQRVINKSGAAVTLYPFSLIAEHGLPENVFGMYIIHEGPIGYVGGELTELSYKKIKKTPLTEQTATDGWIGITERYWFAGLIPAQGEETKYRYIYAPASSENSRERFQTDAMGAAHTIEPGQSTESTNRLFVGAKSLGILDRYEKELDIRHFDLVLDFGMYYFLTKPFFYILHFFGQLTHNMGIALIILTIIVRLSVFPLANTSFRSFAKLRKISPKMQELREKFGDDRQKLQEELVKLYETEKVNPMAGCFPILVQIPIFFALYKVLQISIEMRHAPFYGWIADMSVKDPTNVLNLFGLLSWTPPEFLPAIGAWPCMMLMVQLMQRQMNPPPQDKTQAMMMNLMPFVMTLVLAKFAAGLVIYWTFSQALSILQQYVIMRGMGVEVHFLRRSREDKEMAKEVAEGPAVHPKLEMIEETVEEALFGDDEGQDKAISKPKPKKKKKK
ncbi:MAG: membrane protein insertase YidC [Rhodospirillales bacterium]|nr:membrane protein insertase YidC [Rhodospirillales bacterium]